VQPEQVPEVIEELRPYFATIVEAQLKDYGESANAGCWVSFRLPTPGRLGGIPRAGSKRAQCEDRQAVHADADRDQRPGGTRASDRTKAYKLSQIAGAKCNDPNFRAWLASEFEEPFPDAEAAAVFIRNMCGIESRSQLDTSEHAASLFRTLLEDYDKARGDIPQS
jgi:hypothetical protein